MSADQMLVLVAFPDPCKAYMLPGASANVTRISITLTECLITHTSTSPKAAAASSGYTGVALHQEPTTETTNRRRINTTYLKKCKFCDSIFHLSFQPVHSK